MSGLQLTVTAKCSGREGQFRKEGFISATRSVFVRLNETPSYISTVQHRNVVENVFSYVSSSIVSLCRLTPPLALS